MRGIPHRQSVGDDGCPLHNWVSVGGPVLGSPGSGSVLWSQSCLPLPELPLPHLARKSQPLVFIKPGVRPGNLPFYQVPRCCSGSVGTSFGGPLATAVRVWGREVVCRQAGA